MIKRTKRFFPLSAYARKAEKTDFRSLAEKAQMAWIVLPAMDKNSTTSAMP